MFLEQYLLTNIHAYNRTKFLFAPAFQPTFIQIRKPTSAATMLLAKAVRIFLTMTLDKTCFINSLRPSDANMPKLTIIGSDASSGNTTALCRLGLCCVNKHFCIFITESTFLEKCCYTPYLFIWCTLLQDHSCTFPECSVCVLSWLSLSLSSSFLIKFRWNHDC